MDEIQFDVLVTRPGGEVERIAMSEPKWFLRLSPALVVAYSARNGQRAQLAVQVPEGAEPVAFMRVKKSTVGAFLRIYGLGYQVDGNTVMAWLLPDGSVEVGPDSTLANAMLDEQNVQRLAR